MTQTIKTAKTAKTVKVLNTFKFNKIARICFQVASSKGDTTYNTCFNGDADHGACNCPALRGCYHLDQLRPRAQAYFDSRKAVAPIAPVQQETWTAEEDEKANRRAAMDIQFSPWFA